MKRKPSLRLALYALIAAASLLPAMVLAPWLVHQARELLLDRAMLQQQMFHQQVELRLASETERLFSVLENKSDPIGRYMAGSGGMDFIRSLIGRIMRRERMVTSVALIDAKGRVLARQVRSDHAPPAVRTSDPAFVIPMHGRNYLGAPSRLPDGHVEFLLAVPVQGGQRVTGVLAASVQVDTLWHEVSGHLPAHDARLYLVDSRGTLLASLSAQRHPKGELLTGKEVVRALLAGRDWREPRQYQGVEGDKVFGIATLIPELKWGVISEVPAARVTRSIAGIMMQWVVIVVALHIGFGVMVLLLARRLMRPFASLMRMVARVGRGDYSVPLPPMSWHEMDALASAFRAMVDEIAAREEHLRKLSLAMEQAAEAVMITNRDGIIEYVNAAFTRMSGYEPEEVIGQTPAVLKSGEQDEDFYRKLWGTIKRGEVWEGRLVDHRKDGSSYPVLMSIAPIVDGGEITHFIAIQQDMSEQDKLEAQFRQAQKMESLGSLVGGIAHDFNNSLAAINGNLFMMRRQAGSNPALLDRIGKIETLVESSARMIAQLLTYARKDVVSMGEVDLCALVRETMELVQSTIPSSIRLVVEADCDSMVIEGDVTQIRQMIINLVVNARDAVAGVASPEIRVRLDTRVPDEGLLHSNRQLQARTYACLSVCDNGCGMDAKTRQRIFDPFFTTKEVGKGSGLGLSMVFGAMQRHQGAIEVESEPGEGCCFHLWFPMRETPVAIPERGDASESGDRPSESGQCLLLVDDNPDVRGPIREILDSFGYHVLEASDGAEGLSLFCEHASSVALVISDVVMPEMSGPDMLKAIRERQPEMPAIFITGYDPRTMAEVQKLEAVQVLTKPVPFDTLSELVGRMLASRGQTA